MLNKKYLLNNEIDQYLNFSLYIKPNITTGIYAFLYGDTTNEYGLRQSDIGWANGTNDMENNTSDLIDNSGQLISYEGDITQEQANSISLFFPYNVSSNSRAPVVPKEYNDVFAFSIDNLTNGLESKTITTNTVNWDVEISYTGLPTLYITCNNSYSPYRCQFIDIYTDEGTAPNIYYQWGELMYNNYLYDSQLTHPISIKISPPYFI